MNHTSDFQQVDERQNHQTQLPSQPQQLDNKGQHAIDKQGSAASSTRHLSLSSEARPSLPDILDAIVLYNMQHGSSYSLQHQHSPASSTMPALQQSWHDDHSWRKSLEPMSSSSFNALMASIAPPSSMATTTTETSTRTASLSSQPYYDSLNDYDPSSSGSPASRSAAEHSSGSSSSAVSGAGGRADCNVPDKKAQTKMRKSIPMPSAAPAAVVVVKQCSSCNKFTTPEWRKGKTKDVVLCNACGLRFARRTSSKHSRTGQNVDRHGQQEDDGNDRSVIGPTRLQDYINANPSTATGTSMRTTAWERANQKHKQALQSSDEVALLAAAASDSLSLTGGDDDDGDQGDDDDDDDDDDAPAAAPRRFTCPVDGCDKTYSTSGHAARHSRVHAPSMRTFLCPHDGCRATFTRRDNCTQHQRRRHGRQLDSQPFPSNGKNGYDDNVGRQDEV